MFQCLFFKKNSSDRFSLQLRPYFPPAINIRGAERGEEGR